MKGINQVKFNIVSSFTLSSDDISVISLLYSPLIGSEATGLYLGLQSLLERNNLKSEVYSHEEIFNLLGYAEKSFLSSSLIVSLPYMVKHIFSPHFSKKYVISYDFYI